MAPIQQSAAAATNTTSDLTSSSTHDLTNSVHKVKKESYSSSISSHSDAALSSSMSNSRLSDTAHSSNLRDATQQETLLPISCRGHFFHDSFFEDARQHFEAAVRNVLDRRGHVSTSVHDDLASYRLLRQADLSEDSQAATVTETSHCHKVVLDVRDFMADGVKVKVVDEDEVVVEGSVEQKSGGSVSKKSFRRSFTFPGLVKAADITSTMSADGVLTITVPKKEHKAQITNVTIQESHKSSTSAQSTKTDNKLNPAVNNTQTHTQTHTSADTTRSPAQSLRQTSATTVDSSSRRASRDLLLENDSTTHTACSKPAFHNGLPSQPSDLLLPIATGGPFFQDSFFSQAHQEFEEAMKNVLQAAGEAPKDDVMTSYRSLRERHLTDENQAVSLSEDSKQHKVVLDVRDFMAGDVKVKVVDEDEVVVEGSVEQKSGGSVSKKSFRRSFTFPGLVKAADITSTMSADGVLTITVPKKDSSRDVRVIGNTSKARNNPLTSERRESASSVSSSSTTVKEGTSRTSVRDEASAVHAENSTSSRIAAAVERQQVLNAARESSWVRDSLLPVFPKGPFFHDSFFEESRQYFEAAVQEALGRMRQQQQHDQHHQQQQQQQQEESDQFSLYRSLRAKDLTDESQAIKVTEDEHGHQVVLDVRDFQGGDVKVKVVGRSELQVEGRLEKEEGGRKSSRTFRRRFHLPGVLDVDAVTSALSSDGVLTIKAPKGKAAGRPAAGKPSC